MILSVLVDVLGATVSILIIAYSGVYLSKKGMLDQQKLSYLSKLVEHLFTPCLIFSSFLKTLDLRLVDEWVIPMIFSCLSIFQGMILGYLINKYILKDKQYEAIIILGCGLAMTTNIQLNLSTSLSDHLEQISSQVGFESPYTGKQRAVKYIMIYTFVNTIMRWTLAKTVLVALRKKYENSLPQKEKEMEVIISQPLLSNNQEIQLNNSSQELDNIQKNAPQSNKQITLTTLEAKEPEESALMSLIKSPPIQASVLSVVVCLIPELRDMIIEEGTFLNRSIYLTTQSIGNVILPLVLITLGGNLYLCTSKQKSISSDPISNKSIIGITACRLVILPIIGYVTILIFKYFGLCDDPVLNFIAIVSYSTPSAINLLIIATLYFPKSAMELSKVLLCGYTSNIITLPIVMILFLGQFQN